MIAENPTEAVRESITVPAGSKRAAELAKPIWLTFSLVSVITSVPFGGFAKRPQVKTTGRHNLPNTRGADGLALSRIRPDTKRPTVRDLETEPGPNPAVPV